MDFPAKHNRNKDHSLCSQRELWQKGQGSIKTQELLPCFAHALDPAPARILPQSPPHPVPSGPTQNLGCEGDSTHGSYGPAQLQITPEAGGSCSTFTAGFKASDPCILWES